MKTKGKRSLLFACCTLIACGAQALGTDGFTALNVIPYSPGREDVAAADAVEYVRRTGNEIVLYSLTLHPQGKPAMETVDRAVESYRAFAARLEGTDVRPGILLQAILGHWECVDRETEPWQRAIKLDGTSRRFCPLDKGFRAYIRETAAKLAACHPSLILSDDDVRAFAPMAECFCPLHTAEFNRRTGRDLTPESFRALIESCDRQSPEHRAFTDLQRDTVLGVCRLLREGIDSVDPKIPAGVCFAGWVWETPRVKDYAKTMAAKGQRPFLRLPNGRYTERSPKWDLHDNILFTQAYMNMLGDDVDMLDEADTWPHNLWAKSAVAVHAKLAANAFLGLKGAKLWLVNTHKGKYPVNRRYTDVLAAHRGHYAAIAAAVCGAGPCEGVAIPCHDGYPFDHVKDLSRTMPYDANNWAERVFGVFGVPFHAAKGLDEDCIYALSGAKAVERFSDGELRQLLSRRVLVDGKAAEALSRRGLSALTGVAVEAEKPKFTGERDEATEDGITYPAGCAVGRFRALDGAKVLSSLIWRPYAGADFDRVAPASVLFRNALGGAVLSVAYHMDMGEPYSYSEARKEWLIRRLADLNGGTVPDGIVRDAQNALSLVRRAKDGSSLVFVANLNFDPLASVTVSQTKRPTEVLRLSPQGEWRPADWTWADGNLTVGGAMPCYETIVLKVR